MFELAAIPEGGNRNMIFWHEDQNGMCNHCTFAGYIMCQKFLRIMHPSTMILLAGVERKN